MPHHRIGSGCGLLEEGYRVSVVVGRNGAEEMFDVIDRPPTGVTEHVGVGTFVKVLEGGSRPNENDVISHMDSVPTTAQQLSGLFRLDGGVCRRS